MPIRCVFQINLPIAVFKTVREDLIHNRSSGPFRNVHIVNEWVVEIKGKEFLGAVTPKDKFFGILNHKPVFKDWSRSLDVKSVIGHLSMDELYFCVFKGIGL